MPPPSLNLKKKLSALSLAQSAPSTSNTNYGRRNGTDGNTNNNSNSLSATAKRKMFGHAPSWMRKPQPFVGSHPPSGERLCGEEEMTMAQEVVGQMIFQAGVDYETRPMVVINASALPDPQAVSYDLLLSKILSHLNLYVEADYTVVFFAAGSRFTPSWNWIWKAYRSLSRKYRKNLKQLYIVHSSFFSKMLFSLAGAIISPKFFRKLTYISTLSELASHVPIVQIDIAPAVYHENLKHEQSITMPTPTRSNVFGVPLEELIGYDGEKGSIPRVIKDAAQYLRDTGMEDEGLFRRSPSSVLLRAAQDAYDRGNVVSLVSFGDPNLAAVLIKKYLRNLPEPIFSESTYTIIKRCPIPLRDGDMEADLATIRYIREVLLTELVPCALILLSYVLNLLHDVSLRSEVNLMDANNLAMMITPNLLKGSNPVRDIMMSSVPIPMLAPAVGGGMSAETAVSTFASKNIELSAHPEEKTTLGMVIAFCIRHYYEIFDEVVDRSEAIAPWKMSADVSGEENTYVLGEDDDLDDELSDVQKVSNQNVGPSLRTLGAMKRHRHKNSLESSNPSTSSRSHEALSTSPSAWNTRFPANIFPSHGKSRSVIGIENPGSNTIAKPRRGSLTIGKAATRKGVGSPVEAFGVTAAGFFTPPGGSSPTEATHANSPNPTAEVDEVVNVAERRKMFEVDRA